jgi:hypothetical protein
VQSLNTLSPRAQKAQEQAAGLYRAQEEYHERGPHLNDDKTYVIVPSIFYNPALVAKLKSVGFLFEPGEYPRWTRCVAYALNGKTYTPEQWLESAKRLYKEIYE